MHILPKTSKQKKKSKANDEVTTFNRNDNLGFKQDKQQITKEVETQNNSTKIKFNEKRKNNCVGFCNMMFCTYAVVEICWKYPQN